MKKMKMMIANAALCIFFGFTAHTPYLSANNHINARVGSAILQAQSTNDKHTKCTIDSAVSYLLILPSTKDGLIQNAGYKQRVNLLCGEANILLKSGNVNCIKDYGFTDGLLYHPNGIHGTSTRLNCYYHRGMKRYEDLKDCAQLNPNNFLPIVKPNAEWYGIYFFGWSPGNAMARFTIDTTKVERNGNLYHRVLMSYDKSEPITTPYYTYVREDEGKLYILDTTQYEEEILVLDMSMSVGDTLIENLNYQSDNYRMRVVLVDTVIYEDNIPRKRIVLDCDHDDQVNEDEIWIEGIGRVRGMFHTVSNCIVDGGDFTLRCYYENGDIVYTTNDEYPCWYLSFIDDIGVPDVKIYPNPTSGFITVESVNINWQIGIYSIEGHKIKSLSSIDNQIDISFLPNGHFILELESQGSMHRFLIKKVN